MTTTPKPSYWRLVTTYNAELAELAEAIFICGFGVFCVDHRAIDEESTLHRRR